MRSRLHNPCVYLALTNRVSTKTVTWLLSCSCVHVTDKLPIHTFFSIVHVAIQMHHNANVPHMHKRSRYIILILHILLVLHILVKELINIIHCMSMPF